MIIYNYHRDTGQFTNIGQADPCPVVEGDWLIPAYATVVEPPDCGEDEIVFWENDHWVVRSRIIDLPKTKRFALVKNSRVLMTLELDGTLSWDIMEGCYLIEDRMHRSHVGGTFDGTRFGDGDGLDFA